PKINTLGKIELSHARHPVVEKIVGRNNFISNNCSMDRNTILVTGPNMAGKSTFMRTVAMNVLLAHVGSFVPCALANIPITDRIFTRIGASDNLHTGESTFMTEMNEVSNIVHNATKKSLILLDEVGRGTSTGDGLALAEAILLFITEKIGANTLFATHFHQLTNLASKNPKIKNFKVLTEQVDGQIVFLHKVEPGIEENSFGIDVAKLAGLPKEIIDMARGLYKQG
ncbi:MAG: DNA mismatch repair protein MutS, partial [Firmicutes bacterium]|nr:DNA mismatch repair protein MutS [Bacillota bacterium]